MKTAVVTLRIGDYHSRLGAISGPTHEAYAGRIGADYVVISDRQCEQPHYEKMRIGKLLVKYERVIYLDADAIVRQDCPDLFEVVPYDKVGAFKESGLAKDGPEHMLQAAQEHGIDVDGWEGDYYNTGVMVVSRPHRDLFKMPAKQLSGFHFEQSWLNIRFHKQRAPMIDVGYKFNHMPMMDAVTGEHRLMSYIVHYAGIMRDVSGIMETDVAKWLRGDHASMRRHVLFVVGARLGDVICSEPVARYMVEKDYADSDVTIMTTHPAVFEHLSDKARIITFDSQLPPDQPFLRMHAMVKRDHPIWQIADPSMMNTTDWMSILCAKKTLPVPDRRIQLAVTPDGAGEAFDVLGDARPEGLVLVHPGAGWPSKTFPKPYWESIIGGLRDAGLPVGVIGRDGGVGEEVESDMHGVLDVEIPAGTIDFRNLLSEKGLFYLLSKASVLVSNDSAPVHAAGAFGASIVLIPTCKHPDYVLPYGPTWKAGLYNRLLCDDLDQRRCNLNDVSLASIPGGKDIMDYLPDARGVVEVVKARFAAWTTSSKPGR